MTLEDDGWKQRLMDFLNELGGPREVFRQLDLASRSAWFARTPEFIAEYEGKWVALWNCEVVAVADSIETLREQLVNCSAPPLEVHTDFVQPDPPAGTFIATPFAI